MSIAPAGPEWERFLRHLDLAQGFTVHFLICPSGPHVEAARESCAAHLAEEGHRLDTLAATTPDEVSDLAHRLLEPLPEAAGDLLWVSLYQEFRPGKPAEIVADVTEWDEAELRGLGGLNQSRNLIARHQRRPVILAGTHDLLTFTPQRAPDLWSIRSTVIRLPAAFPPSPFDGRGFDFKSPPVAPPDASLADAERALAAADQVRGKNGAELDLLRYLIRAGEALIGRGHLEKLNTVLDEALSLTQRSDFPEGASEFSVHLNNLAQLLKAINRLSEAEPLMRRALAIDEKNYGAEHPNVGIHLANLAQLLQATNRLNEAEPLMRRALSNAEKSYGGEHPYVASHLNNLAVLLQGTNRLSEAEPLIRRALTIDEKSFGKDHPKVATRLNNLANLLHAMNRSSEAEPLLRRALSTSEKSYGDEHTIVAVYLGSLAHLLHTTNRAGEAEPLMRRALIIHEKSYGETHPEVAVDLNNLANLLQATNRLNEAEPLMQRALMIDEKSFGKEHPKVAIRLNNLANLLQTTNRPTEAEPLMQRATAIMHLFKLRTGYDHPHGRVTIDNLTAILQAQGLSKDEVGRRVEDLKREVETREQDARE